MRAAEIPSADDTSDRKADTKLCRPADVDDTPASSMDAARVSSTKAARRLSGDGDGDGATEGDEEGEDVIDGGTDGLGLDVAGREAVGVVVAGADGEDPVVAEADGCTDEEALTEAAGVTDAAMDATGVELGAEDGATEAAGDGATSWASRETTWWSTEYPLTTVAQNETVPKPAVAGATQVNSTEDLPEPLVCVSCRVLQLDEILTDVVVRGVSVPGPSLPLLEVPRRDCATKPLNVAPERVTTYVVPACHPDAAVPSVVESARVRPPSSDDKELPWPGAFLHVLIPAARRGAESGRAGWDENAPASNRLSLVGAPVTEPRLTVGVAMGPPDGRQHNECNEDSLNHGSFGTAESRAIGC